MLPNKEKWIELGKYIKGVRERKGISAYSIEKEHGFSKNRWSRIENCKIKSALKPDSLQEIAGYLGINYLELYVIVGYADKQSIKDYVKNNND